MSNTAMIRCAAGGYKVGIMIGGTGAGLRGIFLRKRSGA